MQSAVQILFNQHDPRLVALAAAVCILSSLTGISMAERAADATGRRRLLWTGFTALAVGLGIWTTHFIGMLSFDPGFLIGYEPVGTGLSLPVAIVGTGLGVHVASSGRPILGGMIVGLGIGAMHYLGMNSIMVGGDVVWKPETVALSVVGGGLLSAAAFACAARGRGLRVRLAAAAMLTLAICTLHFAGMAALDLEGCFSVVDPGSEYTVELAFAVTLGSILALSAGLLARYVDARDAMRAEMARRRVHELGNVAFEALLIAEAGVITTCNIRLRNMTGMGEGYGLDEIFSEGPLAALRANPGVLLRVEANCADGMTIPVEASLKFLYLDGLLSEVVAIRDIRDRLAIEATANAAHRAVVDSERRLRLLIQSVTDYAIYMLDTQGNIANWNLGAERNKGYRAEEVVGRNFSIFFSEDDRQANMPQKALASALLHGKFEAEGWRYRKDGSRFWASVLVEPIHGDDGVHLGFAKITHDDTRKREDEQRLAALRRNLELALGNMSQGLALFDASGRLVVANERLRECIALPEGDLTQSILAGCLAAQADTGSDGAESLVGEHLRIWASRGEAELLQDMRDGRTLRIVHRPVPEGGWVATYEDISERRRSEEQIVHMARHDALTDLPNRISFSEHIAWALDSASVSEGRRLAVLGIDLDRFKEINDHLGHSVGDAVLSLVADRMSNVLAEQEFVARFGGDEFAAFISYDDDAELHGFIERLDHAIAGRMIIEGNEVTVGASIGVAIFPADASSAEKLIANADMAMYRAKNSLSENVCFYQAEMDEVARARRTLARDLWQAIEKDELHLHYQIQKSVMTGTTTGYEVLLRWNHSERGSISPAEFIPLAEECGAIMLIGEWVLRTACHEAAGWPADFRIAVNLSPVQLGNAMLIETLKDVLHRTGLAPWRLELEVTESAIISDKARALNTLRQIKALGVTIAIDDFGTGYSSLDTLRAFPFDKIKLDRSFIREVETSKQAKAIIRAILALGRSLEVPVLAEGVETMAQLALLRTEGCDEVQGFLLGRPAAPEMLPELCNPERVA